MSYEVIDNRIYTQQGCELNVVHHCNLTCRACSHLSPVMKKYLVDADSVFRDFSTLAKYYRPRYIKLLGGEPLLHPMLLSVIDAIRSSDICNRVHVCTNGILLPKMSSQFWAKVDLVEISAYPGVNFDEEQRKQIRYNAKSHNVRLIIAHHNYFREAYSEIGTEDKDLVHRIYKTCKAAHVWRCHTVLNGYFFKCPQSAFIPQVLDSNTESFYKDGLRIVNSVDFGMQLLTFLESTSPLNSCRHCLGSVGKLFPQVQQVRREWRAPQQYPTEELLDEEFLITLEQNPLANDGCLQQISLISAIH